jgi:DnaK suppressor protein
MVKDMANSKRKPVAAAAKKPTAKKAAPAKKPAAAKKAPAGKPQKAAKAVVHKKPAAPARNPVKLAKSGKPVKKAAAAKPVPKKTPATAKTVVAKKPVKADSVKAVPVKPVSKQSVPVKAASAVKAGASATLKPVNTSKKGKMAAVASKDNITREDGRYALPSTTVVDLPANYHPLAREEYMGPRQLAYFRAKLQKWREDLVEESKQTIDNLREEVRDVGDEAERATRETENSLELRTRDRYRKLIAKIDKALKRIEEGRYGFCEETDEEIGIERLEARPIATLCLDAQERWEHRQKQMGD